MKTNFAFINDAASAALEQEIASPQLSAEQRKSAMVVIAGMSVYDERVLDEAKQKRRETIGKYHEDRAAGLAELKTCGITPLASVPLPAWRQICRDAGLIRLAPDDKGRVAIRSGMTAEMRHYAEVVYVLAGIAAMLAFVVGGVLFARAMWGLEGGVLAVIPSIGISMATARLLDNTHIDRAICDRIMRLYIRKFAKKPWSEIIAAFFPGGESYGRHSLGSGQSVGLVLPEPPPDVQQTLLKAKGLQLRVAAVPEAIRFDRPIETILDWEIKARTSHELDPSCPIIYFEQGSATIIIAQFGDFPIEQEVVERVMNSTALI